MRGLLDTNFLIALFDENHVFHARAHSWWNENSERGWASCPLTENGVVRIMSAPSYRTQKRVTPGSIIAMFRQFADQSNHQFWADAISLREETVFNTEHVHSARQLTDIYLLALAQKNRGRLVTFDSKIPMSAVLHATSSNLQVLTNSTTV